MNKISFFGFFLLIHISDPFVCQSEPEGRRISFTEEVPIKVMEYHNEAYNEWSRLNLQHGIKSAVLIHIDSHDDLSTDRVLTKPKTTKEIHKKNYWEGSFIHPAVMHGLIEEIWCVFPKDIKMGLFEPRNAVVYAIEYRADEDETFYYFTDKKPPVSDELKDKVSIAEVKVHYVYIHQLPDFKKETRPVFLYFDSDYFGTRELDEKNRPVHRIQKLLNKGVSKEKLDKIIAEDIINVTDILVKKNIKPVIVTVAESPEYTVEPFIPFIKTILLREIRRKFQPSIVK